jgi:hypothetical protein
LILESEEGMSGPLDRFARPCEYELLGNRVFLCI